MTISIKTRKDIFHGISFVVILAEAININMNKILTLLFIFGFSLTYAQHTEDEPTDADQTLPEMVIKNSDGEDVNMQSYAANSKITVISFWATWCKPCIKELKNVNELLDDWIEEYDMELVAVSVDDSRNAMKVKPMVNAFNWDFDILLDPNGDLQRAMNVANPPVTFLVNQEGKIVYTHTGYVEGDEYELEDHIKELVK